MNMPCGQRGTKRSSSITRSWCNKYFFEQACILHFAIGDTVERDTTRKAEIVGTGKSLCFPCHSDNHFFRHQLNGKSEIAMILCELIFCLAALYAE